MNLAKKNIVFALTGSFFNFQNVIEQIKLLVKKDANVIPVMSYNSYNINIKFGKSKDFIKQIETVTKNKVIHTIVDSEPIGYKKNSDIMIIAPASGNTIAKLANRCN